ncbi:hypothetical protein ASPZODRAFT_1956626 [Penicilliopsis zonata CBS 506.65]|uniref:Homeobox domain-containing protein n=1 Tax=Penicilliopsis zonata CBS 506.65 TaxID=1073090 RepID=A0A1L9SGH7_9EURO|nr:hypothetical protein ASPZODRAFT_1956626 [Penicilliopsis zonata CBS 506.65]OJJ46375.1 hypothetical protein ASPZODRAFT_1956626 [Penicilliopsis zonata CBS 506.65]
MSTTGPCLWIPPFSSPPHLPGVPDYVSTTTATWDSEQISPKSKIFPLRLPLYSREKEGGSAKQLMDVMQEPVKAESNFAHITDPTSNHTRYVGNDRLPTSTDNSRLGRNEQHVPLSTVNELPSLTCEETAFSIGDDAGHSSSPRDLTPDSVKEEKEEMQIDDQAMHQEGDEGAEFIGGDQQESSTDVKPDKRKMKRFRLTHNQTRFLMSEFTRQAHPDAAQRERLSKEIPGLTPRQVQVWFQNRRAKLKRLTSNDRERMLKSRALPDDFDTTKVLRTPFDHKSGADGSVSSPGNPMPASHDTGLKMLLTDGLQGPHEDDYMISPLSAASAGGNYFPSGTPDGLSRAPRSTFPFPRSSSFSDAATQPPSFMHGLQLNRFSRTMTTPMAPSQMPYASNVMNYRLNQQPSSMIVGYENQQAVEGSVSPTVPEGGYGMENQNHPVPSYQTQLGMPATNMSSHIPHSRHMTMPSAPVTTSQDYRTFTYDTSYATNTNLPYAHANASSMSLPASFPTTDAGSAPSSGVFGAPDNRIGAQHTVESLRNKFSYEYTSYI